MELKKSIVLGTLGLVIITSFFAYSTHNRSMMGNDSMSQQMLATENSIPTEAGKKNFLKQSNNLTQKVDVELVDLDSQIISCDADVSGMTSHGSMSGSCIDSNMTSAESVKGKYM